jgi:hypothetical protein
MNRGGLFLGGFLGAMLLWGCGQSEDSRRIARLEARLAAVDERIQAAQADWTRMVEAMQTESGAPIVVETAPLLAGERGTFLGSTGMSIGTDFDWRTRRVLAEGTAIIRGKVLADGRPRAGVRLQLFLSGIRSAWTTSDSLGFYVVRVPPGKYRYQGFELDRAAADSALSGMLQLSPHDLPVLPYVEVSPERPGTGPEFVFVTAVTPLAPLGRETLARDRVRLAWAEFPGATEYEVSLMESDERGRSARVILNQPPLRTSETFLVIPDRVALSPGKGYSWSVTAFNARGDELSRSPDFHISPAGFKVE